MAFEDEEGGQFTKRFINAIGVSGASTSALASKIGMALRRGSVNQFPSKFNFLLAPLLLGRNTVIAVLCYLELNIGNCSRLNLDATAGLP
jgi:hypothetical protein